MQGCCLNATTKRRYCVDYMERMACPNGKHCLYIHEDSDYQEIVKRSRRNRRQELLLAYPEAAILWGAGRAHSLLIE